MIDFKSVVTIVIFIVTQVGIALIFGTKIATKVDSLAGEFIGMKRDMKGDLDKVRDDLARLDRVVANIEGRLAGVRERPSSVTPS